VTGRHEDQDRPAHRGGVFTTAPWLRAPLLLTRRPSVFLAIVGAAAILAIAASSGVLFLSTLGTASLRAQAADDCPQYSQPSVSTKVSGTELASVRTGGIHQFGAAGLPNPYTSELSLINIQASTVHLFSRPGAVAHVQKLTPANGKGVWFPDVFATKLGVKPGDVVRTTDGSQMRVAGIYKDLAPSPFRRSELPRYWCTWRDQIVPTAASDKLLATLPPEARSGPWLIADQATMAAVSKDGVTLSWYAQMPRSTSLSQFAHGQREAAQAADAISSHYAVGTKVAEQLPQKIAIAQRARDGISGSVVPIDIAGVVVSLLLVAGAGVFWATHRAREVRLLVARGVDPPALGVKAMLETVVPALIGLAGGYAAAIGLVKAVGPSDVLEPGAPVQGALVAAGATVLGLLLIGLIGAMSGRDRVLGASRGWLRFVPWELGLLAIAVWMGALIRNGSGVTVDHTIVRVSPMAFVFPIVGSTAVVLLVGRLVAWLLPAIGRAAHRTGIAGYLALRRIAGSRMVVVGLIIGTALPCCLLTYGSTVTHGVSNEVTTKYRTNLGAEHVLSVYGLHNAIPDAEGHGTFVTTFQTEPRLSDGSEAYVLGVTPAAFREFAFLTSGQRKDVDALHPVAPGKPAPAILVNADDSEAAAATKVSIRDSTIPLDVVSRDAVFPGLRNGSRPMIVVDARALVDVDPNADRENQMWTSTAELDSALAWLDAHGDTVLTEITSDVVIGTTGLLPVTWIFGYLRALAILIGVIAVAGLVFALAARTRRRTVSYVLSRRMGMTKLAHVRSLVLELVLVVGLGWLAGSGVGAGAFGVIFGSLDVYPALPPPMQFVLPAFTLAATAVVTAGVILLASLATHALAERARPAEILRLE
jgi:putative ABC transport system permease protein